MGRARREPKTRKFKNIGGGLYTFIFEDAGKFGSKTEVEEAKKKIGDDYYTRTTRVKIRDYANPKPFQLWKKKKPGRA